MNKTTGMNSMWVIVVGVWLAGFVANAGEQEASAAATQWFAPGSTTAVNKAVATSAGDANVTVPQDLRQSAGPVVYDGWTLISGLPDEKLRFEGFQTGLGYVLEMEFLAWNRDELPITIGRLVANGQSLAEKVVVGVVRERKPLPPCERWSIPSEVLGRGGSLDIQLDQVTLAKGGRPHPFAVHVIMRATGSGAPALSAILPSKIEVPVVRLSPRPVAVTGVETVQVDLGGQWSVSLQPPPNFWKMTGVPVPVKGAEWLPVQVPGELGLQVPTELSGDPVAYCRAFNVPENWRGLRIKLKCDAIFNDAQVWVNGVDVGTHRGNFTPFELDVTGAVRPGQSNILAVLVKWDEETDRLASASEWVGHRIMGIVRKIYVFAVPEVNVADVQVITCFDKEYRDSRLTAKVRVVNEGAQVCRRRQLRLELRDRPQAREAAPSVTVSLPELAPGASCRQEVTMSVPAPRKWEAEHPNLYDLNVALVQDGRDMAVVRERIGFRQIEIRGNQVFINNRPVRYHGLVWADKDAHKGCVLSGDDWRRDMRLLRYLNCNYVRYTFFPAPAAEEFIEACDEVGIFMSEELPVTWTSRLGARPLAAVLQAAVEILTRDRNRASIVQWSLGNELEADQNLQIASRLAMQPLDAGRPLLTDGSWHAMAFQTPHYLPADHLARVAKASPIPVLEGEHAHPACYDRAEHYTDPGIRDLWGLGVADKWSKLVGLPGFLGNSVWFGIDDWTLLPDGHFCGWGEWGVVDIWRRLKPEAWHQKKIFSPIFLTTTQLPVPLSGQPLRIPVENRFCFSDLNECRFEWALGTMRGTAVTSVPPGAQGMLEIALPAGVSAGALTLKAYNTEGVMVDAWRIEVGGSRAPAHAVAGAAQKVELIRGSERHTIRCGNIAWMVDARSGKLVTASVQGAQLGLGGPDLLILPLDMSPSLLMFVRDGKRPANYLNECWREGRFAQWARAPQPETDPCSGWTATSVLAETREGLVEVRVAGRYQEAEGEFVLRFSGDGGIEVRYDFKPDEVLMSAAKQGKGGKVLTPRQLGLVFDLPSTCDELSWRRKAQWTYYPEDHIGRPEGSAKAFPGTPVCKDLVYRQTPSWPWALDTTPRGSADFRSTKAFIYEASLTDAKGLGVRVNSDGAQHVRAWVDQGRNRLLVADVNREHNMAFLEAVQPSPKYKPGDRVSGMVRLYLQDAITGK